MLFLWLACSTSCIFIITSLYFVLLRGGLLRGLNVSHALHTPLMAVTNAISGTHYCRCVITICQPAGNLFIDALAFVAGFCGKHQYFFWWFQCRQRMLAMFRKGRGAAQCPEGLVRHAYFSVFTFHHELGRILLDMNS